ncbi:hypothetical protein AN401_11615 [Zobellella denitrificans]|uniref:Uncharacterized protein n=1 Tax=Zobellella denitrificans TaxID=347534 RepID=A0A291HQI6_9GAMM|nr:hypothetical protein [Zobellella denitrificans]ATG74337.1 hypothetical protein AN401_11120 [Zobellella denitrificans]ATG74420.1 hypothetical protein AN401_11615 [Zobellella denitrificans]
MQTHNLDTHLTRIFGEAAIAMAPDAKQSVIKKLDDFCPAANGAGRPELATEALRLKLDLVAELHQMGVAS